MTLFSQTKDYENALLSLPSDDEILEISYPYSYESNGYGTKDLWKSFVKEYNALSKEEKIAYKSEKDYDYGDYSISISGSLDSINFRRTYPIDFERFPQTTRKLMEWMNRYVEQEYPLLKNELEEYPHSFVDIHLNCRETELYNRTYGVNGKVALEALEFANSCSVKDGEAAYLVNIIVSSTNYNVQRFYLLSEEDFLTFRTMLIKQ
jgi:hypothetical protein